MEQLGEPDKSILLRLGYAVARAQLFEFALLKLLEVQRHDLTQPLDKRWPEIERWLTKKTAGSAANELRVPELIASDLAQAVAGRNLVVHHAWRLYLAAGERHGDAAADLYTDWLELQAKLLGQSYNGLMKLTEAARSSAPTTLTAYAMRTTWREHVRAPVVLPPVPYTS
jgi:23S rRNA G2069 N7-methylase RlmK/C1962 C5-methylase RlmI